LAYLFFGRFFSCGEEGIRFIIFSVTRETFSLPRLESYGERFYDYYGIKDEACSGNLSIYCMEGTKDSIIDFYLYVSLKSSNLFLAVNEVVPSWTQASVLVIYLLGIYFKSGVIVKILLFILFFIVYFIVYYCIVFS
jgi:hypothetical protein